MSFCKATQRVVLAGSTFISTISTTLYRIWSSI